MRSSWIHCGFGWPMGLCLIASGKTVGEIAERSIVVG